MMLFLAAAVFWASAGRWDISGGRQHQWFISKAGEFLTFATYDPPRCWQVNLGGAFFCSAVLPILWAVDRAKATGLQRSRERHGLCGRCGHDLRATQGHCPECGMGLGRS